MVIVIMGVIGGVVAVFMRAPIDAYFDSGRRAALTDVADTAVRRMSRDIRKALPNSIRVPNAQCLEFIPTRTGGRYRAADSTTGDGTALDFTTTAGDSQFNMLGSNAAWPADQRIQVNDVIAVYNLGITGSDAYVGDNTSTVTGVTDGTETVIKINAKQFPLESGSSRFHVIPFDEKVVAYFCASDKTLRRIVTAANFNSSNTTTCPAVTAIPSAAPILATNVESCSFVYSGSDLQRNALVQIGINMTSNNETVSLYHEVHVNNTP